MIKNIDHVGIVVRNIDEVLSIISDMFGFEVVDLLSIPSKRLGQF